MPNNHKRVIRKKCPECGGVFETSDKRKKYDTRRCMANAAQRRWMEKARRAIKLASKLEKRKRAA